MTKKQNELYQNGYNAGFAAGKDYGYNKGKIAANSSIDYQKLEAVTKLMNAVGQTMAQLNEMLRPH